MPSVFANVRSSDMLVAALTPCAANSDIGILGKRIRVTPHDSLPAAEVVTVVD